MNEDTTYIEFAQTLKEHRDDHSTGFHLKTETQAFVENLLATIFPHFCKDVSLTTEGIEKRLSDLRDDLKRILIPLLKDKSLNPDDIAVRFMHAVPRIHDSLWLDAEAITSGDPAAESIDEVILAYPGFTAIAHYRIAHEFYLMHVQIFPRLITEYAHQITGIDIHPGAQIGESFAIDHGTGIVIGESSIIGKNVKMYQGVTLGALSVNKRLAKSKRHPTIEDGVVIYAQAIILGGENFIWDESVLGYYFRSF